MRPFVNVCQIRLGIIHGTERNIFTELLRYKLRNGMVIMRGVVDQLSLLVYVIRVCVRQVLCASR